MAPMPKPQTPNKNAGTINDLQTDCNCVFPNITLLLPDGVIVIGFDATIVVRTGVTYDGGHKW